MPGPGVLAILVAHPSGTWLRETLLALDAQSYDDISYVVVRLGGAEVPRDILDPSRLRAVVDAPGDIGFPAAVKRGLEAVEPDDPYLLLLHDDVAPSPDAVELLVSRAEADPRVAAAGTKLVEWDAPDVLREVGGAIDRFGGRRSGLDAGEIDHGQYDEAEDALFCSAACLLIRRQALEGVGGLDPDGWPLYEDVDLGWRLRRAGHRVVVVPQARARHVQALSRGIRRAAGAAFGGLGVLTHTERGRLWFMLKNYAPVSLVLLLPQFIFLEALRAAGGLLRREFWRLRCVVSAWLRVLAELPHVIDRRRHVSKREVSDDELLRLAGRQAAAERRYERGAVAERAYQGVQRVVAEAGARARDPAVWAAVGAAAVVGVVLRGVLFGGTFTLGELRPPPTLTGAWDAYLARAHPEGFDVYGPASPGILVYGALRALLGGALAEKVALVGPLVLAAFGARHLGRMLGVGGAGGRWLAVLAAVNPFTLALLRDGAAGALVAWAISMWIGAAFLGPAEVSDAPLERLRRAARWSLAWAVAVALHPQALVWFATIGIALTVVRHGDGRGGRRVQLLGIGALAALLVLVPWSLEWFRLPTPLAGSHAAFLADATGIAAATFGAGWPFFGWVGIALGAAYAVGPTRTTLGVGTLLGAWWLGGVAGIVGGSTSIVAVGWTSFVLLAVVARRVTDELSRYAFGWRQVLVVTTVGAVAAGWIGAAGIAVVGGVNARTLPILAPTDEVTGRVLWLAHVREGILTWATDGFADEAQAFPVDVGNGSELVTGALDAARTGRTHRLGALLALANVSHVVALHPGVGDGLRTQADIAPLERQGEATIFRNDAWAGRAMLLEERPHRVLGPRGLADLVQLVRPVAAEVTDDGLKLSLPAELEEDVVLYVSGGARRGWRIGEEPAQAAAAGAWVSTAGLRGSIEARAPGGLLRILYPLQAALFGLLVLAWGVGAYLASPEPRPRLEGLELRTPTLPRPVGVLPVAAVVAAAFLGWTSPAAASTGPFLSSAWYCPPVGQGFTGQGFGQRIAIANPSNGDAAYSVRPNLQAVPDASGTLEPGGRASVQIDAAAGAVVESYGRPVTVAATVARDNHFASELCSSASRELNLFAEGGRAATRARPRLFEAYVLYNPFPDAARASVRFISPDEVIAPPALQDIQVGSGATVLIDPEEQFEPMLDLSTEVSIWQGRAVVARRICVGLGCKAEDRSAEEVFFSLPSGTRTSGVLPRVSTLDADTSVIAVNPGDDVATVSLFAVTEEGSLPKATFEVPARSRQTFEVDDQSPDLETMFVRFESSEPVAIESLVVPDDRSSVSLFPPVTPARRWAIPAAQDRVLWITNPGTRAVRVTLERMGDGPEPPGPVVIEPNRVATVPLETKTPYGLLVSSSGGPVTAAVVGGTGALVGVPLG